MRQPSMNKTPKPAAQLLTLQFITALIESWRVARYFLFY